MKKTLQAVNCLLEKGIIQNYAIAGGMAQFYYIEPSITYDLDLVINIRDIKDSLNPLGEIYKWADENQFILDREHFIIEGIPVQFLIAYNDLISEALLNATGVVLFDENTFILKAEYLMAIMLQTGRLVDKERFARFIQEAEYDEEILESLIRKYNLQRPLSFK
ncbi:MAG TPA: hypothetical protein PK559_07775 [Ignavibacteriaceae bacterium]|nr:hypothetical protein [Ignavibacteriaceae bacterium]